MRFIIKTNIVNQMCATMIHSVNFRLCVVSRYASLIVHPRSRLMIGALTLFAGQNKMDDNITRLIRNQSHCDALKVNVHYNDWMKFCLLQSSIANPWQENA